MRVSGLTSVGPNCEKSTAGTAGQRASRPPAPARAPAAAPPAAPLVSTRLTNAFTSSCVMRPLKPVPPTAARFTPSSRASLRMEGLACACAKPFSSMGCDPDVRAAAASAPAASDAGAAPARALPARAGSPRPATAFAAGVAGCVAGCGARGIWSPVAAFPVEADGAAPARADAPFAAADSSERASGAASWPAPSSERTATTTSPALTLPPLFTATRSMMPPTVEGTSIVASSVSSVTSGDSGSIRSPGLTSTSMTATSLKLPMSGTSTSMTRVTVALGSDASSEAGIGLRWIDAEGGNRLRNGRTVYFPLFRERLQCSDRDEVAIDLEVLAQLRARIRAPVPVRPEGHVAPGYPLANLLGHRANVVGRGHDRPRAVLETLAHVRYARGLLGVQEVAALAVDRLAAELAEAGHRVHIRRYAEIALEQLRGRDALAQDRARAEQRR